MAEFLLFLMRFLYVLVCFVFSESVWVSNSKKDPETLSMMLKTSEAKSPFEQKRVKEIKQLNTKVDRLTISIEKIHLIK